MTVLKVFWANQSYFILLTGKAPQRLTAGGAYDSDVTFIMNQCYMYVYLGAGGSFCVSSGAWTPPGTH